LAVQGLNEALCFVSSSELVDSFVLRSRQLLVPAKRYKTRKEANARRGALLDIKKPTLK